MSARTAPRPPDDQRGHSRTRSASIFNPFSSRKPTSPTKANGSPRKLSAYQSPTKDAQQRDMASRKISETENGVLQDCHNRAASSPRKTKHNEEVARAQKSPSKITSMFGRNASKPPRSKDKENTVPDPRPLSSAMADERPPPIWAQYATQQPSPKVTDLAIQSPTTDAQTPSSSRSVSSNFTQGQSRVKAAVAMYDQKHGSGTSGSHSSSLSGEELNRAFEAVLVSRNIPENTRQGMRGLDANIKRDFIKNNTSQIVESAGPEKETSKPSSLWGRARAKSSTRGRDIKPEENSTLEQAESPSKRVRSRSRGRVFTLGKGDKDSSKRQRSNSRPRSLMSLKNLSSSSLNSLGASKEGKVPSVNTASGSDPDEYVAYLKADHKIEDILVGKIANLRRLVRNETVAWTDDFIVQGGMSALIELLLRIMKVEWREEHEDALLHEVLRTLKGLATTQRALANLALMAPSLFPSLLRMLFDEERKGPSEFSTREIIVWLLFQHLSTALPVERKARASELLEYLADPSPSEDEQPVGFISNMRQRRPYLIWCKELDNVCKEVFWIFLHHMNTVTLPDRSPDTQSDAAFYHLYFPKQRAPVPSAPYVGGVEWDATNYIASHIDLMNGLIASFPSRQERNTLRQELKDSSFEKLMGSHLRLCKEKFYGNIHDGLRTWVAAAKADDWNVYDVSNGPAKVIPTKSPYKPSVSREAEPPKLQLPKFDLDESEKQPRRDDDMWI